MKSAAAVRLAILGMFLGTLAGTASQAQQVPTAGDVEATLPEPAELEGVPVAVPEVSAPAAPSIAAGGPTVLIEIFELTGNSVIATDELLAEIEGYRGKPLTVAEIYEAADRLASLYRQRGYALASVAVPEQRIGDGIVRLDIMEGRLAEIRFEGNRLYRSEQLSRHLDELVSGEVMTTETLERELLLLNELPGLRAQATVQPGEQFGTSDVIVRTEEDPIEVVVRVDNYGRESLGEGRILGDFFLNSPFRLGDQLAVSVLNSEGGQMQYARVAYNLPVTKRGTRLEASYSRFTFDADADALGGIAVSGDGTDLRGGVTHPLIRSRTSNLRVGAGYGHVESSSDTLGILTADDFANLIDLSARYDQVHRDGSVTVASVIVSTNLKDNPDGLRDNAEKARFELALSHTRPLPGIDNWTVQARGRGVLSFDPLMDIRRFRIGGPGSVRGFAASELSGDQGFSATVQVSRRVSIAKDVPGSVRLFWDGGVVHRKAGARAASGESANASLTSAGAGFSLAFFKNRISADFDVSTPLTARQPSDAPLGGGCALCIFDEVRIFGVIAARF